MRAALMARELSAGIVAGGDRVVRTPSGMAYFKQPIGSVVTATRPEPKMRRPLSPAKAEKHQVNQRAAALTRLAQEIEPTVTQILGDAVGDSRVRQEDSVSDIGLRYAVTINPVSTQRVLNDIAAAGHVVESVVGSTDDGEVSVIMRAPNGVPWELCFRSASGDQS